MADALIQAGAGVAITGRERSRTEAVAAELGGGGVGIGLDVRDERCISMNEQTMTRRGFVPYGPSGAGVEALARVMAADLAGTTVTVNVLLPGGATVNSRERIPGFRASRANRTRMSQGVAHCATLVNCLTSLPLLAAK